MQIVCEWTVPGWLVTVGFDVGAGENTDSGENNAALLLLLDVIDDTLLLLDDLRLICCGI